VRLLTPHCRFDTQRMLSKKTARMGDKARPSVECRCSPAASLSEINPFVLAVTSRKIESKFRSRASDTKAMTRPPYGQGADFGLHLQRCRGLFYSAVLWKIHPVVDSTSQIASMVVSLGHRAMPMTVIDYIAISILIVLILWFVVEMRGLPKS
jgi:hypothetical protein